MALRAVGREIRRGVIRVRRFLKIGQVAANTRHTGQAVIVVHVALGTLARRNGVRVG